MVEKEENIINLKGNIIPGAKGSEGSQSVPLKRTVTGSKEHNLFKGKGKNKGLQKTCITTNNRNTSVT